MDYLRSEPIAVYQLPSREEVGAERRCVHALIVILAIVTIAASLSAACIAGIINGAAFDVTSGQRIGPLKLESAIVAGLGLLISGVKSLLPLTIVDARRENRAAGIELCLAWLATVAYCSAAPSVALLALPAISFTGSFGTFVLLATGWLVIEILSGVLPMIAGVGRPAAPTYALELPEYEAFGGDVSSLLEHVLISGVGERKGLAMTGPRTIICTQSALADHAGCSKTEAHRQLRRLEGQGQITLTTTKRETWIEIRSTPLARCT